MSTRYHVLITGANRGLGLGLAKLYLAKPNTTVIAATRDPESSSSKALLSIQKGANSALVPIKIESTSTTDPATAVKELASKHGIQHLDLVIANAGVAESFSKIAEVKIEDFQRHMEVNVYGVVRLFQAVLPMLEKASTPKWVSMSSNAGSISEMLVAPNVQYGTSKVALNYVTAKIQQEHENLLAFAIHPGWVATDMGNFGARSLGLSAAPNGVDESVQKIQNVIDNATKEAYAGKYVWPDGQVHPW